MVFVIFGLPIYLVSLSSTLLYGLEPLVPVMQWFKEILAGLAFITVVFSLRQKPRLSLTDKLALAYFLYVLIYLLLPIGKIGFKDKLVALKSIAFFPVLYFTGRFIDPKKVNLNRCFQYICVIAIPAAIIVVWEKITYTHFQTYTGYADYMWHFYGLESSGHHNLNWTFEAENDGPKRFASFFANPLDHAAGTLTVICAILALITTSTKKIRLTRFWIFVFFCSLASIVFALSRASFASYFIILYAYAYITNRRAWLQVFHYGALLVVLLALSFLTGDIYQFIVATLNFTNSSSIYHIMQWVEGIQAVIANPLGIGLGTSGGGAAMSGTNVGGESEVIIIAVQCGLAALGLFIAIYTAVIRTAIGMIKIRRGKARRLAIFVLLLNCGMIIPYLTAEAMSYVYVLYLSWFFTGLMMNIKQYENDRWSRHLGSSGS
ncbi:hypothetical protein [Sediminibacterium soli]|uniref:hypothetical protein n=1 Tax=Sediminibacterium soli TaxID=2698829 RepID=UPI00137B2071|nr:hypothetical protein [Sediminibacterium soli]NCI48049.1 hypothetical protein [Sediminibacterium soli]